MLGGGWHTSNADYGKGVGTALPARPALNQKAQGTVPQDQPTQPDPYVPSKGRPSTHLPGQTILTGTQEEHTKSSEVTQTVRVEPYPPADYSGAQLSNLRLRTGPLPAPTRQYMEEYCDRLVKNMTSVWPVNPLSSHDAMKHHFTSPKTHLIFLQLVVLEWKFPRNWFTNTTQFSWIFYSHQIIHYKSRIAAAIHHL